MEIVKVKKDEVMYFTGVAPADMLGLLTLPNAAAIGAVEKNNGIGLLIFTKQAKESVTMEWLYVDEKYRGIGAGSMLIEKIFYIAERLGVKRVCARLGQDEDFEAKQLYLMQWGFSWMKTLPGEWNITASEFMKSPFAKRVMKMKEDIPDVKPLSEVSTKALAIAVDSANKEGASILYDVVKNRKFLDPEMSVVTIRNGKIVGMMLIHRQEGVVHPAAMWAQGNDPAIISKLFAGCIKAGSGILKDKEMVRITAGTNEMYNYERKLVSGIKSKTVYMMQAAAHTLKNPDLSPLNMAFSGPHTPKDLFRPADIPGGGFRVAGFEVR